VIFQVIMVRVEGQDHSWFAGVYWTLVTMSTLGYGDIGFLTDLGRAFSVLVLLSGIILLLVVLPFVFIRHFYAPWLETQLRLRAPRKLREDIRDHVILCDYDPVAESVIEQLDLHHIPYVILDPDPERAARRHADGLKVLAGALDSVETFRNAGVDRAKLVLVNSDDTTNTNLILTVRSFLPTSRSSPSPPRRMPSTSSNWQAGLSSSPSADASASSSPTGSTRARAGP
jgi:voltage-gated potassium channel